jgi:hypothetical protein
MDAEVEWVECYFCHGSGKDPDLVMPRCPICAGKGEVSTWQWEDEDPDGRADGSESLGEDSALPGSLAPVLAAGLPQAARAAEPPGAGAGGPVLRRQR